MSDYVFGSYILEILTAGMYQDSRIIFREYIQNACDAIDEAVSLGIMSSRAEGEIRIEIDPDGRNITIEDNGTGIRAEEFVRVMGSIADSEKRQSENKGFRGVGKLCGLAYCRQAVFSAKFRGECEISRLVCDAKKMRQMIGEDSRNQYRADEILNQINDFLVEETENVEDHFFRVELRGINEENTDLLDFERVKEYLSFAAPLPYDNGFMPYGSMIHDHAKKLGLEIDEYNIFLNDEQLFKMYTRRFAVGRGKNDDEFFDLSFIPLKDINNTLLAWMWFGMSHFTGAIDANCPMRGIRLRKGNIQIGDEDTLQPFFTESRGIHYFIGELFCVSKDLIPNSRRDYFNENPQRVEFERLLRIRFKTLSNLYHDGSEINSAYRKIDDAKKKREDFDEKVKSGSFSNASETRAAREVVAKAEEDAEKAQKALYKIIDEGRGLSVKIIEDIEKSRRQAIEAPQEPEIPSKPKFTQKETQLLNKVFGVIKAVLKPADAQRLIHIIQDRLK